MKLYIARHGQTDWNIQHKAQGRSDIPLNETGRKQAEVLHDKIKDIKFDAVYASPLQRARETAEIATNQAYEIIFDDRLMERSFGDFEGKVVNSWIEATGYDIGNLKLNTNISNIEPVRDVLVLLRQNIKIVKQS